VTLLVATLACLGLAGAMLARLGGASDESRATTLVRAAVGAFAALVVDVQALSLAGHATPLALLIVTAATGAALALATARFVAVARAASRTPWTALEVGLAAALVAALATRFSHGLHRTTFLYDTLSYHLHAPATWMRDARLSIVPAVFGDVAPAYAPSNVELLFWMVMAPLRSDVLAQAGQVPLAALACAAVAAAVREAGGPRAAALAAALVFLYVPEVWQQAPTAMVDLGMAAFLLASLPFAVRLRRAARASDAVALGLAVGLCAGTKVVGAVYVLPVIALVLPALAPAPRAGLAALGGALAAGGYWYARNLVATGNPLYPMTVALGSATIFPGVLDAADVRASAYHLARTDAGALGRLLLDGGGAFALATAVALVRARTAVWPLLTAALVALFWLVVPYQESRFLFPAYGVAAVALALPRDAPSPWRWAPLAVALAGSVVEFPTVARWGALAAGAVAGIGVAALGDRAPARGGARWWLTVGAVVLGATAAELRGAIAVARAKDPGYDVGDDLAGAWSWTRQNAHGARVAYTGNNLPFPLWGRDLAGDVRYVNVAGSATDRLHDFARRVPRPRTPTPEPAPYRAGADYETWRANLRATRRDLLFVAALYPEVRRTISTDGDGFPLERAWADAHPEAFTLRFASEAARVYAVAP
jgi:hypothetical protein